MLLKCELMLLFFASKEITVVVYQFFLLIMCNTMKEAIMFS